MNDGLWKCHSMLAFLPVPPILHQRLPASGSSFGYARRRILVYLETLFEYLHAPTERCTHLETELGLHRLFLLGNAPALSCLVTRQSFICACRLAHRAAVQLWPSFCMKTFVYAFLAHVNVPLYATCNFLSACRRTYEMGDNDQCFCVSVRLHRLTFRGTMRCDLHAMTC